MSVNWTGHEAKDNTVTDTSGTAETGTADRETVVSHDIDAAPDIVFEAFTEVRHLSMWFGPNGFTTTTKSFDFRVGGEWDFVMHGPDGTHYPNWVRWRVIDRPRRIVMEHGGFRDDPDAFEETFTFESVGDRTRIVLRNVFPTVELRDQAVARFHAVEGGRQTLSRLAAHVVTTTHKQ
ncbi:ATPase [Gordonia amarae]|uniref:ATPase n=1 Tax=Gordonia amarae TaxID=36821 RepID=A0A857MDW0_9ACTN|nr:ATPase [Gordonia amarae]QHN23026.1 ATPase [Gordonia amarae]QHN31927.1 ATPase [Gordonia amarae]QHN40674.1 ATPase [Gordonia amarae]